MTRETNAPEGALRFEFGENWSRFLSRLDEPRITRAEEALCEMLEVTRLDGVRFLDAGSGSGLASLAARRLGARVHSFDFDPRSVACTAELRRRYRPEDAEWTVERGSVLDDSYLEKLGRFDVIYCWGVLHHTGHMWNALGQLLPRVADGGRLWIAIYNDQGPWSRVWTWIKRTYVRLPAPLRRPFVVLVLAPRVLASALFHLMILDPARFVRNWIGPYHERGMSRWHDAVDWVGGYPFEVARPEEVFDFCRRRGFRLTRLKTSGGSGCNEFVFEKAGL